MQPTRLAPIRTSRIPTFPTSPRGPFAVEKNRVGNFRLPGTSQIIVQKVSLEFSRPLKRGDRVLDTTELIDCSALKDTRVGPGYFATFLSVFSNQDDEVVGRSTTTLLMYGSPDNEPETMSGMSRVDPGMTTDLDLHSIRVVSDVLQARAPTQPQGELFRCGDGEWRTNAEIDGLADRIASSLAARGVGKGDRVALLSPNREEILELFFGCARLGPFRSR